jgi:hypothetical protein
MLSEFFANFRSDLSIHREDIQAQFTSVKADLSANQESVRAELHSNQTKLEQLQERLLQSFEARTQELRTVLNSRLESVAGRVSHLVTQVQTEKASELVAFKRQLQSLGNEFDSRLDQSNTSNQLVVNELADQMQEHRSEVSSQMARQKESLEKLSQATTKALGRQFDLVNAKVVALESQLNEMPTRQAFATEGRVVVQDAASPSAGQANDPATGPEGTETSGGLSVKQSAVLTSQLPVIL